MKTLFWVARSILNRTVPLSRNEAWVAPLEHCTYKLNISSTLWYLNTYHSKRPAGSKCEHLLLILYIFIVIVNHHSSLLFLWKKVKVNSLKRWHYVNDCCHIRACGTKSPTMLFLVVEFQLTNVQSKALCVVVVFFFFCIPIFHQRIGSGDE